MNRTVKDTVPVMAGYIVLGIGFGMILKANGYGILWALALSTFVYAGSMQYMFIELLSSGASLLTFAVTTLLVNARHIFYGISMVDRYKNTGKIKPYLIFALTDETYSLMCGEVPGDTGEKKTKYYFWVSLFNHFYWVLGSVLGSLMGYVIKINTEGLDFALTALFLVIVTEQWLSSKEHRFTIIGFSVTTVSLIIFGPESFLIPSMICITILLFISSRNKPLKEGKI